MRLSHPESVKALAFSPDGRYLISAAGASGDVLVSRYVLRPQDLINEGCSRLTRNFTTEEWKQYLGDQEPYRRTCPEIP